MMDFTWVFFIDLRNVRGGGGFTLIRKDFIIQRFNIIIRI